MRGLTYAQIAVEFGTTRQNIQRKLKLIRPRGWYREFNGKMIWNRGIK